MHTSNTHNHPHIIPLVSINQGLLPKPHTLADIFQSNHVLRDLTIQASLEILGPYTSRRAPRLPFLKFLNKSLPRFRLEVEVSVTCFEDHTDSVHIMSDVLRKEAKSVAASVWARRDMNRG
jgi:hypothetical protein